MEWFKHYTDSHDSEAIATLMDEHGHKGYAVYFMTLEICQRQLHKLDENGLTPAHCTFRFHQRVLTSKLRVGVAKTSCILRLCAELGLLSVEKQGSVFQIGIPNLLKLLSRDARLARQARAAAAPVAPLELELESELEKETKGKRPQAISPNAIEPKKELKTHVPQFIAAYVKAYQNRYGAGTRPELNGKVIGQIGNYLKDVPIGRACELIQVFCQMDDQWFLKKCHDFGSFASNQSKVGVALDTGASPGQLDPFALINQKLTVVPS